MPSDKEIPINVDVGATAKYERKTSVSIDVPEDVTRAKADAFLKSISPFTESLALVGDWLADTRVRLRIQRIQKLIQVAGRAQELIDQQSSSAPSKIPTKALLPILEKASLEEPGDEILTSAWAGLLASASLDYDAEVLTFTRILSELGPREAAVLDRVYGNRREWATGTRNDAALTRFFESEATIKPMIRSAVLAGDQSLFGQLGDYVDGSWPMEFTVAYTRGVSARANWIDKRLLEAFYAENRLGYTILARQGLIEERGQSYSWAPAEVPVGVDWVSLTDFGGRFMARVAL